MSTNGTTKKRRRAYGRVCERPGGKGFYVQFPDPTGAKGRNGRTRYVTRAVKSKREGERFLAELRKAKLAGTLLAPRRKAPGGDLTVRQAVDGHIDALRAKGGSESTIDLYGYSFKPLEKQGLAGRRIRDVTAADVEAYLGWRRKNVWRTQPLKGGGVRSVRVKGGRASASTIARDRELLHAAFERLRRLGEIETNVVASVPKPKRKAKKRVVLSKAEVARFLAACRRHLRPVALALAYTGARKGEILALRWRDLNFEDGTIALARPKVSNFSQIPLHPGLAAELLAVREARAEARGRPVPDSEHVFLSRYGKPFKSFKTAWSNAVARAGLSDKGVTPHAMRHSFACHFLAGGAAVTDLQAMLGHASLATTQIYARMVDRRTRASVEALDFGS